MIRIAFTLIGGKSWIGGHNYLINLLRIVTTNRPELVKPVLFFGTDTDPEESRPFEILKNIEIIMSPALNVNRRTSAQVMSILFGSDKSTRRLFHEHKIDVVFENARFHGKNLGIPAIAWIPDFQHRELPHLFTKKSWWKRELGFRMQIKSGRTVMVSSNDSRRICERYYPGATGRTHVVRFAVLTTNQPSEETVTKVRKYYNIHSRYFYLPNQFWQHKNHLLVLEAVALLKQEHPDIVIIASGKEFDPNKPNHFKRIVTRRKELKIEDQFRLLGLVPYKDVTPLMVGSVAVLNPSLFEGWSTTIEEAKGLQVPLILSDLSVHKEQADGIARFFDRTSAPSLAKTLVKVWLGEPTKITKEGEGFKSNTHRIQRFADDFINLVRHVVTNQDQT